MTIIRLRLSDDHAPYLAVLAGRTGTPRSNLSLAAMQSLPHHAVVRQRRLPARAGPGREPVHHRGLYAQIIGGILVAVLVGLSPWVWNKMTVDDPTEVAAKVVGQLAPGVALSRYEALLGGPPAILRPIEERGDLREAIWVAELYAVQAVVDHSNQVVGYSVTTTSDGFRPPLERFTDHQLGATKFVDIVPEVTLRLVDAIGTPRGVWWYSEALEPGAATHFDTIVLTASDASAGDTGGLAPVEIGLSTDATERVGPLQRRNVSESELANLRERLVIGTYTILGPDLDCGRLPEGFRFGPSIEDIWAVRPPPR